MGIDKDLVVGLEPFSPNLAKTIFMKIEEPEKPIVFRVLESVRMEFATIGQFYRSLIDKLRELGKMQKPLFPGDPARQVFTKKCFSPDRLFAITGVETAAKAVALIIEEGEGTTSSPLGTKANFRTTIASRKSLAYSIYSQIRKCQMGTLSPALYNSIRQLCIT